MDVTNTTLQVARKLAMAEQAIEGIRSKPARMVEAPGTTAEDWARYANELAEAEGVYHAWARINMTVVYFSTKPELTLTGEALLDTIVELLGAGPDDTWSGRGNDVRGARFDGVRKACSQAKYLVIAD